MSLNDLLSMLESGDEDLVKKSQYLLGILYMNGSSSQEIEKDDAKSLEYLKESWDNGVSDAGLPLASIYYNGSSVEEDNELALCYLKKSAKLGFLRSQRELAKAYLGEKWEGLVKKDIPTGIEWLERAANSGDLVSASYLADFYYQGEIVEKDLNLAFDWLVKASESKYGSDINTFDWMAKFYEEGIGTEVDLVQAYKYYDLTGTSGSDDKERLSDKMTQDQIDEAIRLSREWQEKHNTFVPSYDGLEHQPDGSFR
uniref:tetratricopeptide repeat protein n=1 Tax=Halomonas sp. TaxID=1486246 RepID=UPI00263A3651|nr:tetratricopeptide repeat protein [Halomonas sp.]